MEELKKKYDELSTKDKIYIGAIAGIAGLVLLGGGFLIGRRAGFLQGGAAVLAILEKALTEMTALEAAKKVAA